MCSRCVEAGASPNDAGAAPQCISCRARPESTGSALRRDRIVWGELLGFSFDLYKKNFARVTLATLALLAPFVIGQLVSAPLAWLFEEQLLLGIALSLLVWIAQLLAQGVVTLSALDLCIRLARGEHAPAYSLQVGLSRLGALLAQYVLVNLGLGFASLCAAAPVIAVFALSDEPPLATLAIAGLVAFCGAAFIAYTALGFSFAACELVAQPRLDAFSALRNAWAIARGERLTIFFGLALVALLALAGALACFVGLIFTLSYAALLASVLYVALRNGAQLPH
jgi:hypothetical protein